MSEQRRQPRCQPSQGLPAGGGRPWRHPWWYCLGSVWSRTAQLSCVGCPPSAPLAGPSCWVTHSLGHLPASPLFSLGLLGRSQALGLCQVVHSDGQEDVQQGVWWLQLRKDVYAPASPGSGHGFLHATQGPISPGPGQPCLLPGCPPIPQPSSHVSPRQTQPSLAAGRQPPSLLDAISG